MRWAKIIIISALIGVVIGLTSALVYVGIKSQSTNPEFSYFVLTGVFVVIVLAIDMYFGKKTDNKLDEIKGIVRGIEGKIDGLSKKNNDIPALIEVTKLEDYKNQESLTRKIISWFQAQGHQ